MNETRIDEVLSPVNSPHVACLLTGMAGRLLTGREALDIEREEFGDRGATEERRGRPNSSGGEPAAPCRRLDRPSTISIHASRRMVRISHADSAVPGRRTARRGRVEGFSSKSRKNLFTWLNRVAWGKADGTSLYGVFLSMTYGQVWPDEAESKRHLWAFWRRLRRRFPQARLATFWKMEYQQRRAPHFHLVLLNLPYVPKEDVAAMWGGVIGQEYWDHTENAPRVPFTRIEGLRSLRGVKCYIGKYIGKPDEGDTQESLAAKDAEKWLGELRVFSSPPPLGFHTLPPSTTEDGRSAAGEFAPSVPLAAFGRVAAVEGEAGPAILQDASTVATTRQAQGLRDHAEGCDWGSPVSRGFNSMPYLAEGEKSPGRFWGVMGRMAMPMESESVLVLPYHPAILRELRHAGRIFWKGVGHRGGFTLFLADHQLFGMLWAADSMCDWSQVLADGKAEL